MSGKGQGLTADVAAFACAPVDPPPEHAEPFARAVLDTVGSALAGTGSPPDALLSRWAEREATTGRAMIWTTGRPASVAQAALVNGTAAHALDWDDVSAGTATHPSAVLVPALLAMAEELGANGVALTAAYDVGAAAFRALAHALPRSEHYRRGWHTTATVGRLAVVAALANLCELDETRTRHALGLAGSLASGSLANFGTMTKPLHAGLAARDGVFAVQLAVDGFTANPDQLDDPAGFFALFGDPAMQDLPGVAAELARWRTGWTSDWALKRYPACYATHRAIDAVLELRGSRLPERVEVVTEPGGLRPLLNREPATGTEAKFSMAYVLAVALIRGVPRLADFTDAALADESVRKVMGTVSAVELAEPPVGSPEYDAGFTVVAFRFPGGGEAVARVDRTYGDASRPLSAADLRRKFTDGCAARGLSEVDAKGFADALLGLPAAADAACLREFLATEHERKRP